MALRIGVIAAAALVLASAAAAAPVRTKTAHLGAVRATITWQPVRFNIEAKRVHLVISRRGRTLVDRKLGPAVPWTLKVRDLDGNGEAEVIADFYTGGAHCCLFSQIYRYDGSGYVPLRHVWGDPSYALRDLNGDGRPELVSADDHFAYAFTSYAGSALPVQAWRYRAGHMADVTRSFPSLVRKNAATLWKEYEHEHTGEDADVRGVLAAWMADQYLLGQQDAGWTTLQQINAQGGLSGNPIWPTGDAYLGKLRKLLTRLGYAGKG
jgi:hypothetical protein